MQYIVVVFHLVRRQELIDFLISLTENIGFLSMTLICFALQMCTTIKLIYTLHIIFRQSILGKHSLFLSHVVFFIRFFFKLCERDRKRRKCTFFLI